MADKSEIKVTRTYSLDPAVIAWVTQRAARLTMANLETEGKRISDSEVVNSILAAAMEDDLQTQAAKAKEELARRQQLPLPLQKPVRKNKRAAESVAA